MQVHRYILRTVGQGGLVKGTGDTAAIEIVYEVGLVWGSVRLLEFWSFARFVLLSSITLQVMAVWFGTLVMICVFHSRLADDSKRSGSLRFCSLKKPRGPRRGTRLYNSSNFHVVITLGLQINSKWVLSLYIYIIYV